MSGEHSPLAPSSAARRVQCPGSTLAEAAYPEAEDSPEAAEGTAAHWAVSETLSGRMVDVGDRAPNGVFLTEEMIEAADAMHDDIARELAPYGMKPEQGQIEQRVQIPRVHALSWGTPDYFVWVPGPRWLLLIYDFKFGYRQVEVFENNQLVEYAAGAMESLPPGITDMHVSVTAKIVQPRTFHRDGPIRTWRFNGADIRALVNIASNAAHEALAPNPSFHVGPECRDCQARHACPTLQRSALEGCDLAGAAQPFDLPAPAMAIEYRTLKRYETLIRARISGLEEQLLSIGKSGKPIPGLRIEHGAGRERWTIPDDVAITIGKALGVDIAKAPEVMTPKQALKAGLPPATLAGIVNTPRGKAELVDDDGTLARRIFG